MMRLQTRQGRQVVRQEGVAEGREVHGGHRVQRRQRLVAQQRARAPQRRALRARGRGARGVLLRYALCCAAAEHLVIQGMY